MDKECRQVLWILTGRHDLKTVHDRDVWNGTPLHTACFRKNLKYVEVLIRNDADVNIIGNHGHTQLFIAIEDGNLEIVKMLLKHGADPLIKNDWGFTALSYAQSIDPESNVTRLIEQHLKGKS